MSLPFEWDGYSQEDTKNIFKNRFTTQYGFTEPEFEQFWDLVIGACSLTPWSAEITFNDVFQAFREIWRPDWSVSGALVQLEIWLENHALIPPTEPGL